MKETVKKQAPKKKISKFKAYENRQKAKGLQKVTLWIPAGDVVAVKTYVNRKKKAHDKKA